MRIFYAADKSPNASLHSQLWRNNLLLPLRDLGHEVIEFEYDLAETFRNLDTTLPAHRRFIATNRPRVSEALLQQLRAAHAERPIDLFFSYFYDACVTPETIDEIRALGIATVNFYCNASYQLHLVAEISPHYDWCLVPEKFRLGDYKALGARPIYCQMAANPNIYKPVEVPPEYDVSFIGQAYGDRPEYIRRLLQRGIDVRLWGPGWRERAAPGPARVAWRQLRRLGLAAAGRPQARYLTVPAEIAGPPLSDAAMIETYSKTKINLGFSSCGETHRGGERILQVRLRDFEVPMSGGFYMVEQMDELGEFYDIGREIVCYNSPDDLADKIEYYLAHDAEREAIRRAGHERALKCHSWQHRFQTAFEAMGLA